MLPECESSTPWPRSAEAASAAEAGLVSLGPPFLPPRKVANTRGYPSVTAKTFEVVGQNNHQNHPYPSLYKEGIISKLAIIKVILLYYSHANCNDYPAEETPHWLVYV